jgi:hypothetical protein
MIAFWNKIFGSTAKMPLKNCYSEAISKFSLETLPNGSFYSAMAVRLAKICLRYRD